MNPAGVLPTSDDLENEMNYGFSIVGGAAVVVLTASIAAAAEAPTREQAVQASDKAVRFFHSKVATHGGYVWRYSSDLRHRQGEGLAYDDRIWVQPPGTPAVGLAFLKAYHATGHPLSLQAAREAAEALVKGQLHSGGWHYSITFDLQKRRAINYRQPPTKGKLDVPIDPKAPGGWAVWRKRRYKSNLTVLDDNTTQSALQLLMRVDEALEFKHKQIHEAAQYGLKSLDKAQYPVGAWSHNYDRFPRKRPSADYYPVRTASHPRSWSRNWTKAFAGCYLINDRISLNAIETMLDAYAIYGKQSYLETALRGGDFLLRAQMPEPQPAWAQQYDRHMQPVWDRPFEPPAITGLESQDVLETLLLLYRRTGKKKYLDAVPKALVYLRRSQLDDGKLARFYELKTNRPLYFTRDYKITYKREDMPDHYQFVVNSRLDGIALRYRLLARGGPQADIPQPTHAELTEDARRAIATLDDRGAWTEPGWVRDRQGRKVRPPDGIIRSQTFIDNVETLSRFIVETGGASNRSQ